MPNTTTLVAQKGSVEGQDAQKDLTSRALVDADFTEYTPNRRTRRAMGSATGFNFNTRNVLLTALLLAMMVSGAEAARTTLIEVSIVAIAILARIACLEEAAYFAFIMVVSCSSLYGIFNLNKDCSSAYKNPLELFNKEMLPFTLVGLLPSFGDAASSFLQVWWAAKADTRGAVGFWSGEHSALQKVGLFLVVSAFLTFTGMSGALANWLGFESIVGDSWGAKSFFVVTGSIYYLIFYGLAVKDAVNNKTWTNFISNARNQTKTFICAFLPLWLGGALMRGVQFGGLAYEVGFMPNWYVAATTIVTTIINALQTVKKTQDKVFEVAVNAAPRQLFIPQLMDSKFNYVIDRLDYGIQKTANTIGSWIVALFLGVGLGVTLANAVSRIFQTNFASVGITALGAESNWSDFGQWMTQLSIASIIATSTLLALLVKVRISCTSTIDAPQVLSSHMRVALVLQWLSTISRCINNSALFYDISKKAMTYGLFVPFALGIVSPTVSIVVALTLGSVAWYYTQHLVRTGYNYDALEQRETFGGGIVAWQEPTDESNLARDMKKDIKDVANLCGQSMQKCFRRGTAEERVPLALVVAEDHKAIAGHNGDYAALGEQPVPAAQPAPAAPAAATPGNDALGSPLAGGAAAAGGAPGFRRRNGSEV